MPVNPENIPPKVQSTPKPSPSLEPVFIIHSLNNLQIIEFIGQVEIREIKILINGAAQINACVHKVVNSKPIFIFDGIISVKASDSCESPMFTAIPGLFEENFNFFEAPIKTHDVIFVVKSQVTTAPNDL